MFSNCFNRKYCVFHFNLEVESWQQAGRQAERHEKAAAEGRGKGEELGEECRAFRRIDVSERGFCLSEE